MQDAPWFDCLLHQACPEPRQALVLYPERAIVLATALPLGP